jgi:perosamine synthetase
MMPHGGRGYGDVWTTVALPLTSAQVINCEREGTTNAYWMTTVVIDKSYAIEKQALMAKLGEYGIQTRPFFYPLSELPPLKREADTPVSYDLSPRAINLPSAHDLTEDDVDYVCAALRSVLNL